MAADQSPATAASPEFDASGDNPCAERSAFNSARNSPSGELTATTGAAASVWRQIRNAAMVADTVGAR